MTKSKKTKKEKAADFTKPKLKLGKGKKPATNAVDTSFKARSIALPQQSIAVSNETSAPTTKRKLTLDALLTHLKHYGAGVRRDALLGLQELLGEHPALIQQNLSKLVNSCVRLISDEDASVRRALHAFFSWLLPRIPKDHLVPHASTLLLFTASAQSHIFPEIRLDAIRLLDLLLELIPEQVVSGFLNNGTSGSHGRKLLDGYLGLLNVGTRFSEDEGKGVGSSTTAQSMPSMTSINLSIAAKTTVLKSFSKFVHHAIGRSSQEGSVRHDDRDSDPFPLWYLAKSFKSQEAFASFSEILSLQRSRRKGCETRLWSEADEDDFSGQFPLAGSDDSDHERHDDLDVENILAQINRLGHDEASSESLDSSNDRLLNSLCRTLNPVLVSIFLDCAPSVFSPTQPSPEAELELVHALMMISRCLYGRLLRDADAPSDQKESIRRDLDIIVTRMTTYFPFGENRMFAPDIKVGTFFEQMNLIYCELFSLRSLDYTQEEVQGRAVKRRKLDHSESSRRATVSTMSGSGLDGQSGRVREYVIRCLSGIKSGSSGATSLGQSLTAQTYMELLPTLWWLLDRQDRDDTSEILKVVLNHATKAGSTSGVKPVVTEFVGRLILLQAEPSYKGPFRIGSFLSDELQKALRDWCYHLPKVVWELGDKNLRATELILLLMLRLLQRRLWLNDDEMYAALCTRFAPFFTIQHATRGDLRGPFSRLDKTPADPGVTSEPNNLVRPSTSTSVLKRLALDVAAVLVSTTCTTKANDKKTLSLSRAPRKFTVSDTERRTGDDRCPSGSSVDPVSVPEGMMMMGSSAASLLVEAQSTLRNAVQKAVSGTAEEAYWLDVSRIRL